jgi:hypothetical protein
LLERDDLVALCGRAFKQQSETNGSKRGGGKSTYRSKGGIPLSLPPIPPPQQQQQQQQQVYSNNGASYNAPATYQEQKQQQQQQQQQQQPPAYSQGYPPLPSGEYSNYNNNNYAMPTPSPPQNFQQ